MGNTNSSQKISAQDKAILDMKIQRDKLHQYQKRITVLTDRETEVARQCLAAGQRDKALLALRRKKFQQSLLAKADGQLEQLQRLTADVEFAALQKDVVFGLQQGTAVLKQIHAEMGGIEGVERLLEDNAEARAYVDEVSEMLGGQLSRADEEDVDAELEALEEANAGTAVKKTDKTAGKTESHKMPDAPSTEPVVQQQESVKADGQRERQKEREMVPAG